MFFCFKFVPVGVIPAGSTADSIEEAVHTHMWIGVLLCEVALNAGEKYKERVIALYVLACYVHAHCFAEHLIEVAEVLGVDYLKGNFGVGFLMDDFNWTHSLDITDFKSEVVEIYLY